MPPGPRLGDDGTGLVDAAEHRRARVPGPVEPGVVHLMLLGLVPSQASRSATGMGPSKRRRRATAGDRRSARGDTRRSLHRLEPLANPAPELLHPGERKLHAVALTR